MVLLNISSVLCWWVRVLMFFRKLGWGVVMFIGLMMMVVIWLGNLVKIFFSEVRLLYVKVWVRLCVVWGMLWWWVVELMY